MRSALLSLAFVATLLLPAVDAASAADSMTLASRYDVAGTNPNGSAYSGTATVKVISDTTFTIKWDIAGSVYEGFGMRLNDTLSATYTIDGEPGLVMYKVDGTGIKGLWAIRGHNGSGTEKLTPRD
ncbi:MAG TPA: hypothetical protein VGG11_17670 [Xanthobacteraceae bacterium]|jgi:hypothetical protein